MIGARSLIKRYGITAVSEIANELYNDLMNRNLRNLNNPGGFFVWKVRQLAGEESKSKSQPTQRPNLRVVGESPKSRY